MNDEEIELADLSEVGFESPEIILGRVVSGLINQNKDIEKSVSLLNEYDRELVVEALHNEYLNLMRTGATFKKPLPETLQFYVYDAIRQ